MKKIFVAIALLIAIVLPVLPVSATTDTEVEAIFPVASVSAVATGFLSRYVDVLLTYWPIFIGVAVMFGVLYLLLRKARHAIHGKL